MHDFILNRVFTAIIHKFTGQNLRDLTQDFATISPWSRLNTPAEATRFRGKAALGQVSTPR